MALIETSPGSKSQDAVDKHGLEIPEDVRLGRVTIVAAAAGIWLPTFANIIHDVLSSDAFDMNVGSICS